MFTRFTIHRAIKNSINQLRPNANHGTTERLRAIHHSSVQRNRMGLIDGIYNALGINTIKEKDKDSGEEIKDLAAALSNNDTESVKKLILGNRNLLEVITDDKSLTPLLRAICNNNVKLFKWLIEEGKADHTKKDNLNNSAFLYASYIGNLEIMRYLISKGYSQLNEENNWGQTALHHAAMGGQLHVIKWLLQQDANLNILQNDNHGNNCLLLAASYGKLEIIKWLLNKYEDNSRWRWLFKNHININLCNDDGDDVLMLSIKNGHVGTVVWIVEKYGITKGKSKSFFLLASAHGHEHIITYLIKNNYLKMEEIESSIREALKLAFINGHVNIVQYLLENQQEMKKNECLEELKQLLKNDLNTQIKNREEMFYIVNKHKVWQAIKEANIEQIKNLLQECPKLEEEEDKEGNTLLHFACKIGEVEIIKFLVSKHVPTQAKNEKGETPLHVAAVYGHIHAMAYLIDYSDIEKDKDGLTPIATAIINGHHKVVIESFKNKPTVSFIDEDNKGNTLMHLAIQEGRDIGLIKILLDIDSSYFIYKENADGLLPMHLAAKLGRLDFLKEFHHNNVSLEKTSGQEKLTPLHYAVQFKHIEIIEWFTVETKINLEPMDAKRKTPVEHTEDVKIREIFRKAKKNRNSSDTEKSDLSKYQPNIKNIAFQGGGVKGIAYLGALEELDERGMHLGSIEKVAGTSVGAITALLLGLGYDLDALKKEMETFNFTGLLDNTNIGSTALDDLQKAFRSSDWLKRITGLANINNLLKIIKELREDFGIYNGTKFDDWIKSKIKDFIDKLELKENIENLTFEDLHNLKEKKEYSNKGIKDIYVIACNLSTGDTETFSFATTPKVIIADAVRCSMSIPFIFKPHNIYVKDSNQGRVKRSDNLYVDGGVVSNDPINIFNVNGIKNMETIGLRLVPTKAKGSTSNNNSNKESFIQFFSNLLYLFYTVQEYSYKEKDKRSIEIDTMDINSFNFSINDQDKELLRLKGKLAIHEYVRKSNGLYVNDETPLQVITRLGNKQSTLFNIDTADGIFSLFDAAKDNEIKALSILKINLNVVDKEKNTALHIAAYYGRENCVSRLLNCGATPSNKNNTGQYPLDIAWGRNYSSVVITCIKNGCYDCSSFNYQYIKRLLTKQLDINEGINKDNEINKDIILTKEDVSRFIDHHTRNNNTILTPQYTKKVSNSYNLNETNELEKVNFQQKSSTKGVGTAPE